MRLFAHSPCLRHVRRTRSCLQESRRDARRDAPCGRESVIGSWPSSPTSNRGCSAPSGNTAEQRRRARRARSDNRHIRGAGLSRAPRSCRARTASRRRGVGTASRRPHRRTHCRSPHDGLASTAASAAHAQSLAYAAGDLDTATRTPTSSRPTPNSRVAAVPCARACPTCDCRCRCRQAPRPRRRRRRGARPRTRGRHRCVADHCRAREAVAGSGMVVGGRSVCDRARGCRKAAIRGPIRWSCAITSPASSNGAGAELCRVRQGWPRG